MASLGTQFVPEQLRDEVLAKLMAIPENKVRSASSLLLTLN